MKYLNVWNIYFFHVSVKDSVTEMVILFLIRTMTTHHDTLANTGYDALELRRIYTWKTSFCFKKTKMTLLEVLKRLHFHKQKGCWNILEKEPVNWAIRGIPYVSSHFWLNSTTVWLKRYSVHADYQ